MKNNQRILIKQIEMIAGLLPDGRRLGKLLIETKNLGNLEWFLTPEQAFTVGTELIHYARYS